MNRFAYKTTGRVLGILSYLLRARTRIHGAENLPEGSIIFAPNHFTRFETFLLPYHLHKITRATIWSLADHHLFIGAFGRFLSSLGALSTQDPERDRMIIKTLLAGRVHWIIFPEGRMVKNQKYLNGNEYMIHAAGKKHPPHTGVAALALRAEFYRQRIKEMLLCNQTEAIRLREQFGLDKDIDGIIRKKTYIVPVNISYFPLRAHENALSRLAGRLMDEVPERVVEELYTEGSMLLSGVDIDIRFGEPIDADDYLYHPVIRADINNRQSYGFDAEIPSKPVMKEKAREIMLRYMKAIYSLTTVNYDHIFASLLRQIPGEIIDLEDFRRRAFLVLTEGIKQADVHTHSSLKSNQIHLLTDDRFNRLSDFLSVAEEKRLVQRDGNRLILNTSRLLSTAEFHRARLDNPTEVMANAIEPLEGLQKQIRRFASITPEIIRKITANYTFNQILAEYREDSSEFGEPDEAKIPDFGKPYLIKGRRFRYNKNGKSLPRRIRVRDVGVVLIHGYMASPFEVKELAKYLAQRGIWVCAPRLRGHGTSPADLAGRKYDEWIESAEAGYAVIRNNCRKVVLGGFSTGAGLALDLAARVEADRVFAVCPPMKLQNIGAPLVPYINTWNQIIKRIRSGNYRTEFVKNTPENPHINYLRNPVAGVRELGRLIEQLRPKLKEIDIPALVIQALNDPVVDHRGTFKLYRELFSEKKEYLIMNFDRHGILLGEGALEVYHKIWDFIRKTKKK